MNNREEDQGTNYKKYAPKNIDGLSKPVNKKIKMWDGIQCCHGFNTSTRNAVHNILCVPNRSRVPKSTSYLY